jgi:DNA-binding MarR family transcriptional regulator
VVAFDALARVLIGLALDGVQAAAGAVTLTQFRLLLTLDGLGRVPSSHLAAALGSNASSVTRLADKLEKHGYLTRGADDHNRSIVTLGVSAEGHRLVVEVLARRHASLATILDRMDPVERETATRAAAHFAALADPTALAVAGPVPL